MSDRRVIVPELNTSSQLKPGRKSAAIFSISRFLCAFLFIGLGCRSVCCSIESIRAEIGKETAWTGEAVPLIVTLYSPGPFNGTAVFDLPQLPQTAFTKTGNPLVGSEKVGDATYLTQRHEFTIYTQRSGEIIIPSFRVRFSGKKSFTTDAELFEGSTPELRFTSRRPPGTESMGVVISARSMEIQQTWNPVPTGELKAGDVIVRTITRNAEGTTAMMLPPISTDVPEGVQVYARTPDVNDTTERGDANAHRTDTVSYQFQRSGHFTLPELTFVWWDPGQETLKVESIAGLEINVADAGGLSQQEDATRVGELPTWTTTLVALFVAGFFAWLVHEPVGRWIEDWRAQHNNPAAIAERKLRAACFSNDAPAAYMALMAWLAAQDQGFAMEKHQRLTGHWQALSRFLFASEAAQTNWQGNQLWAAFSEMRRTCEGTLRASPDSALPTLNPGVPRDRKATGSAIDRVPR